MNSKMVPRAAAVGLHCFASNGWPPCGRRNENCADFVFKSDELLGVLYYRPRCSLLHHSGCVLSAKNTKISSWDWSWEITPSWSRVSSRLRWSTHRWHNRQRLLGVLSCQQSQQLGLNPTWVAGDLLQIICSHIVRNICPNDVSQPTNPPETTDPPVSTPMWSFDI